MPDNDVEPPTPTTDAAGAPDAAGAAPSDQPTDGAPATSGRSRHQRPHRAARTRLVRRRSARRMQQSDAATPAQPRATGRRRRTPMSSGGPGPRRRTRSQPAVNGASAAQRPTRRGATVARKPAVRGGSAAPSGNGAAAKAVGSQRAGQQLQRAGSANGSARRSRRAAETALQPAAHSGGRKASRLTRSASYRTLGKDTPTIEPVASSLGQPLQLSARPWSSLGTAASGSNAVASGATYRALGRSGASAEQPDQSDTPGTAVYRSLGRSSLPLHRAQSPLRQSSDAKDGSKATARPATRPTRRSRLHRASQRPRPSRAKAAPRNDD